MPQQKASRARPGRGSRSSGGEQSSAALLLIATVLALLWANLLPEGYRGFWDQPITLTAGGLHLDLTFASFVDEALMAFFFFVVGLEVKAELVTGALTDRRRALVPVSAAVLGLIFPALLYLAFTAGGDGAHAWGVVISTDTAFLLGALALIRPKHPSRLRTFLLVLAVVDDIGALGVIAIAYSADLAVVPLLVAALALSGIWLARRLPVGAGPLQAVLAVVVWFALHEAGVHPTLAGVLVALALPVDAPRRRDVERVDDLTRTFRQSPNARYARDAVRGLRDSISVGERLRQSFAPVVNLAVLPVFALANAGVVIDGAAVRAAATSPIFWGVVVGLVAGKTIGITLGTWAISALGLGRLAPGLTLGRIAGGATLSGIGFTISLLIAGIALPAGPLRDEARLGVLAASVIAFLLGWAVFSVLDRIRPPEAVGEKLLRGFDPERDHYIGRPDAKHVLVEYGDFECPFCSRATGILDEISERFAGDLVWIWRHLPRPEHPHAELTARASEAADRQGAFRPLYRAMFDDQEHLTRDDLLDKAAALGLDVDAFAEDLDSDEVDERVVEDTEDAALMDLHISPTFFIDGRQHHGPWDAATLIAAIERSGGAVSR